MLMNNCYGTLFKENIFIDRMRTKYIYTSKYVYVMRTYLQSIFFKNLNSFFIYNMNCTGLLHIPISTIP
jgi:hypothetical protein